MNKLLILFVIFIAILLIIIVLLSVWQKKIITVQSPPPVPMMSSVPQTSFPSVSQELFITAVDPTDNSTNKPLDQVVRISFNRNFSTDEVDFRWSPVANYSIQVDNKTLIATPKAPLASGFTYAFYVVFKQTNQSSKLYQFTTTGEKTTILPNTFPSGAAQQAEEYNRQNHPDVFLANKLPYSTADFTAVKAGFKQGTPSGHFYFTVTLKGDPAVSKNAFLDWLRSLQLTDAQIQGLDIEYQ